MEDNKNKKKTLTISTNVTKKIDLSSLSSDGKKTFSVQKKAPFKPFNNTNKSNTGTGGSKPTPNFKSNFVRKFAEQQIGRAHVWTPVTL